MIHERCSDCKTIFDDDKLDYCSMPGCKNKVCVNCFRYSKIHGWVCQDCFDRLD